MGAQKTVTINGRLYDAATGLPVKDTAAASRATPAKKTESSVEAKKPKTKAAASRSRSQQASSSVHGNVQKSKTLVRRATKKPVAPQKVVRRPKPGRHMDIARNTNVAKFAPHPVVKQTAAAPKTAKPLVPDAPARVHPAAERALAKAEAKKQAKAAATKPPTAKEIKEAAISKAMAAPKVKAPKEPKRTWVKRLIIAGSIVLVIALALFAVYKFIPSVSVGIAAAQANVAAKYPEYTPDGYSLNQPVTYTDGEVTLQFNSNSNDTNYTITQQRSTWDSSAVLDNIVIPIVNENYTTTRERGLTVYTYESGAAWVNGGVLYTINGTAALSGDQVRRIATSL